MCPYLPGFLRTVTNNSAQNKHLLFRSRNGGAFTALSAFSQDATQYATGRSPKIFEMYSSVSLIGGTP
jgi:fluoride ion exporter CrcB/FEX